MALAFKLPEKRKTLSMMESIYDMSGTDEAWLKRVAHAFGGALNRGCGVHGYFVKVEARDTRVWSPLLVDGPDVWRKAWRRDWWDPFMVGMGPRARAWMHRAGAVTVATEIWAAAQRKSPALMRHLSRLAEDRWSKTHAQYAEGDASSVSEASPIFPDSFNLMGLDATYRGCVLVANLPQVAPSGALSPAVRGAWSRVAAHLAAGLRLRRSCHAMHERALHESPASLALRHAEAIFTTTGRLEHVHPSASPATSLKKLKQAAQDLQRCKGKSLTSDECLDLWRSLVLGRWTMTDVYDRDGKRFVVARPNNPVARARPKLTGREEQVLRLLQLGRANKVIAYELGIGESTVSTLLTSVRRKLGLTTRAALVNTQPEPPGRGRAT